MNLAYGKKEVSRHGRILILGEGEIFGEESVSDNTIRNSSCVCTSNGNLLVISKTEFFKRIKG